MADSKLERASGIQNSIGKVLFEEWDPICVNDNHNLSNEYDSYTAPVFRILTENRSEEALIDFLFKTQVKVIGCDCENRETLRPVAKKLLSLNIKN
jgi:hypothetical protein